MSSPYSRLAEARARNFELQNAKLEREQSIELSLTDEAHVFPFYGPVDDMTVPKAIGILDMWSRKDPGCEIEIVFCSPGGSVVDGLALFDFIRRLQAQGHKVTTRCIGQASSMGAVLMQAGGERVMTPNSFLHIHQISQNFNEKTRLTTGQMEDESKIIKKYNDTLLGLLAERSSITKKQIDQRWKRTEWLLSAEEAVELGFADRIES